MTLDLAMREAMRKCIEGDGAPVEVTYTLGEIPWKITVEIDEGKIANTSDKGE